MRTPMERKRVSIPSSLQQFFTENSTVGEKVQNYTTLTCFAKSFEGTGVPGQLEDADDSEHLDNPDEPEKIILEKS